MQVKSFNFLPVEFLCIEEISSVEISQRNASTGVFLCHAFQPLPLSIFLHASGFPMLLQHSLSVLINTYDVTNKMSRCSRFNNNIQ